MAAKKCNFFHKLFPAPRWAKQVGCKELQMRKKHSILCQRFVTLSVHLSLSSVISGLAKWSEKWSEKFFGHTCWEIMSQKFMKPIHLSGFNNCLNLHHSFCSDNGQILDNLGSIWIWFHIPILSAWGYEIGHTNFTST